MARRARVIKDGGTYHVINRINEGKELLRDAHFKHLFLTVLRQAKTQKKFRFHMKNITIMDNHVHIMLRMRRGQSLSKLMQWVFSVFAMRYNRMNGRQGHLWMGRFKSVLIETTESALRVFEYICNNPVKAGMVTSAKKYEFGYFRLMASPIYMALFDDD